jgi:hypothetical protein
MGDLNNLRRLISDAAGVYGKRPLSGLLNARRSVRTAAFDPETGFVDVHGMRFVNHGRGRHGVEEAQEVGKRALERYLSGEIYGMYDPSSATAAYPVHRPHTRRHELFHGIVHKAAMHGDSVSPYVDMLGAIRKKYDPDTMASGAARIAEELSAHSVGYKRPLSLSEAADIARRYAPSYREQNGLRSAIPAYAIGYSPPLAVGAGAGGVIFAIGDYAMSPSEAADAPPEVPPGQSPEERELARRTETRIKELIKDRMWRTDPAVYQYLQDRDARRSIPAQYESGGM